jgi:hypothetical protein
VKFTTRVTEADFVAAYRLKCRSLHRRIASAIAYTFAAVFWLFLIGAAISRHNHPDELFLGQDVSEFLHVLLPGAVLLLLWVLAFRVYPAFATRRKFLQAKSWQGEILNEASAEGLWQKTSGGSYGFSQWQDFSYWRESEEIMIVVYPSDVFCLLPKATLSSDEQTELRDILMNALPQK